MQSIYHHLLRDAVSFEMPDFESPVLRVTRAAHEIWDGGTTLYRDRNSVVAFLNILSGKGIFSSEGQAGIPLESGMLAMFGPDQNVTIEVPCGAKLEVIIVRLSLTDYSWIVQLYGSCSGAYRVQNPGPLQTWSRELFREAREGGQHVREVCDQWMRLILLKASANLLHKKTPHDKLEKTFLEVRRVLHHDFRDIQTIKELSVKTGYTAEHIGRLFRQFEGTGAYEYLLRLKMNTAADELTTTDASIGEIAQKLGFDDPYSFSRAFKRTMGKSPSRYRNS
jgi:AraC-like DNA-binding protein